MQQRKRKAEYLATLIYLDEPQLLALRAQKAHVVAVAVPSEDPDEALFLAVTVSSRNWESYLDGTTDLRFLFTYPKDRLLYYFDLMAMKDNKVTMTPFSGLVPEEHLPLPRLFSTEHTEEFDIGGRAEDEEHLIIDGEWEMPEFGQFYQRYSDIYAFVASLQNWSDPNRDQKIKNSIVKTYRERAFEGGFSYVHFFHGLNDNMPRDERPGLERIKYASPGIVDITGKAEIFADLENIVRNYLNDRNSISEAYAKLYAYLSRNKYLQMPGNKYDKNDATAGYIFAEAEALSNKLGTIDFSVVKELADQNALVVAKIILALYRRVESAASFFAQGRMSFSE
ncbi:hypothetical protein [Microvirga sp. Mcv34]|uniref:hypothetical protein n=1 Tax=Microvirga sp. Mcv34 TaxID=2926016 RepID=UPI0021CAE1A2|nr:hypothetical protein [Microvirga sp. Mcv34]